MHHYLTYFDCNYAARGIAMIESLHAVDAAAHITVVALDDRIGALLDGLVDVWSLAELGTCEPRLGGAARGRTRWEHIATHKPVAVARMLDKVPPGDLVAFVDADSFFFSSPTPVFDEVAAASIALSPHRLNRRTAHLAPAGRFNAGFIVLRNDAVARRAVAEWTEECLEWCYDRAGPDGRYMNQGYLNGWPTRYPGVHVLEHPGANLALWNVESHRLEASGRSLTVDGAPLVSFHYSSMATSPAGAWFSLHPMPRPLARLLRKTVFATYFAHVAAVSRRLEERHGFSGTATARRFEWGRVSWLTGWRAHAPLYRTLSRIAGYGARRLRILR